MSIRGIDVSDYQPNINWRVVSANAGISFAFIKATEGRTFVAEVFDRYWKETKANGIIRGAYHFFRPASDVRQQAENFLRTVKLEDGDLPPVLDIESTDGVDALTIRERMAQWLTILEEETGILPIIYTYPGFWDQLGSTGFTDHPLWIAHYTSAPQPIIPGGWKSWVFWQYTDRGELYGVPGKLDINLFESLQLGDSGPKVEHLQKLLQKHGFDVGTIDGKFGSGTRNALINFQQFYGIESSGTGDLRTWTFLMGRVKARSIPSPSPTPQPLPEPEVPIRLINVGQFYQGFAVQDQALNWLQGQIPQTIMAEFAQKWRNLPPDPAATIRLTEACKYYRGLYHQNLALESLEVQINLEVLTEFAKRWRGEIYQEEVSLGLIEACQSYQGSSLQNRALEWLEGHILQFTIAEFAHLWRQQPFDPRATIRLADVCRFYRGLPSQNLSLEWLEKRIPLDILKEFGDRWKETINLLSPPPIELVNVCKYYQGLEGQKEALKWLQGQIDPAILAAFASRWREDKARR
jgi:lysozyme